MLDRDSDAAWPSVVMDPAGTAPCCGDGDSNDASNRLLIVLLSAATRWRYADRAAASCRDMPLATLVTTPSALRLETTDPTESLRSTMRGRMGGVVATTSTSAVYGRRLTGVLLIVLLPPYGDWLD